MTKEEWNKYKDLEYYPDRVCKCGCGGRIKVRESHRWDGIPDYLPGHFKGRNFSLVAEVEAILSGEREAPFCKCECGGRIEIKFHHKYYGIPEYIRGHNPSTEEINEKRLKTRRNTAKENGYWCSEETKRKIGEANTNKVRSKEIREQWSKAKKGENHYNWRGGVSNFPYSFEFNEEFKTLIRERDNHTCQLCGRTKVEEGRNLCVHHIGYDKENDCSNEFDFTTLCNVCNFKVNYDRESWTEFFRAKLELKIAV